jgi:predicted DNA-binding mobile mystery protein A
MTQRELAERVGVTQAAIRQLEESERDGVIQLKSLRRVAEALGARLEYALVPEIPLTQAVRNRAFAVARRELAGVNRSMELEQQRPAADLDEELVRRRAEELIESPRLWTEP